MLSKLQKSNSIEPGVYDIDIDEYHLGKGYSRSALLEFQKSPFHFWYSLNNKEERQPVDIIKKINAFEFGNALHTYVLERETFPDRYVVMPKVKRNTKAGKQEFEEIRDRSGTRQIICEEAFAEIELMAQSIDLHEEAGQLIGGALYEKSIYWNDPGTDLLCKVRPDIWHSNFIGDLKTCVSGSYKDFQRSIVSYGYHIQAGMIQEAIKHVLGEKIKSFVYIAIEKDPPYAVAVYQLDEMAVEEGVAQFRHIIKGVKECLDSGDWPGYPTEIMALPTWAFAAI